MVALAALAALTALAALAARYHHRHTSSNVHPPGLPGKGRSIVWARADGREEIVFTHDAWQLLDIDVALLFIRLGKRSALDRDSAPCTMLY